MTRQEPSFDDGVVRPAARREPRGGVPWLVPVLLLAAAAAAWLWWPWPEAPQQRPVPQQASIPVPDGPAPAADAAPAILHPVPTETTTEPLQLAGVPAALEELLGRTAVLGFLQATDFPRRFAATVDSLGREHAPVAAWPVQPVGGRFLTEPAGSGDAELIAAGNASRYDALVRFAGAIDARAAVALYRRMYPLLQQAYRDLGFGDRYLNDRVVQVIDLLLATPEPATPPQVRLTEVKGPIAPVQPWTRYEFVDERLQSLAAGQKMLLRVGPAHRQALKAKLRELRAELVGGGTARARP